MFVISRNRVKRSIVWLLVIAMFACTYFAPFSEGIRTAYAEGVEEGEETEAPQEEEKPVIEESDDQAEQVASPDGGAEVELFYLEKAKNENKPVKIEEECDAFTTIFQNPDGTKTAYLFAAPVRFKDENGEWQEIDSQLVEVDQGKKDKGYKYQNKTNTFDVFLPENMVSDVPVSLVFDDYTIEMKPIQLKVTSKEEKSKYNGVTDSIVVNNIKNEVKFDKEEDKEKAITDGTVEEIEKYVKYNSGYDDRIELVYTPTSSGVKEEIIIKEYTGQNEFSFLVKFNGVTPVLLEDSRIFLNYTVTGEYAGVFGEMYMYDSYDGEEKLEGDHYSEDISYKLEETKKKGEYIITVVADKSFLEDEDTVYPVIIDPTYTHTYDTDQDQFDTYAYERLPNEEYYTSTHLRMGNPSSEYPDKSMRSFVKHALKNIEGGLIKSATYSAYEDTGYTSTAYIDLYRVTESWSSTTLNWGNKPDYDGELYASKLVNDDQWYHFNITKLVSEWYQGTDYYGFMLKERTESSTSRRFRRFISQDGSSNQAYLTIVYTNAPTTPGVTDSYNSEGEAEADVSWTEVPEANLYRVYMDGNYAGETSSASFTVGNVMPGTHSFTYYARNSYEQWSGESPSVEEIFEDRMAPYPPAPPTVHSVTQGAENSGECAQLKLKHTIIEDRPSGNASYYRLLQYINGTWTQLSLTPSNNIFTLSNLADNTTYSFRIRAYDAAGNHSDSGTLTYSTIDRTPPTIDSNDIWLSSTGTNNTNLTVNWENIYDGGPDPDVPSQLKFRFNDSGVWEQDCGYSAGQKVLNCSAALEGQNDLNVIVYDPDENYSTKTLQFTKDTEFPEVEITLPGHEVAIPEGMDPQYSIQASASDLNLTNWSLDYALAGTSTYTNIDSDSFGTALENTNLITWDLSTLEDNRLYTLRLTAEDIGGNIASTTVKVLYAIDADDVQPYLTLELTDDDNEVIGVNDEITVEDVNVAFTPSTDMLGTLYVNDEEFDELAFDSLAYDSGWVYPEGSQVFLRVMSEDTTTGEYHFTNTIYEGHKISDSFDNTNEITNLTNTVHVTNMTPEESKIELSETGGVYSTTGSFESLEQTINGRVSYVTLTVDETKPTNTAITYELISDTGDIFNLTPNTKVPIDAPMNTFHIKALMTSNDSTDTPSIESWHLDVTYVTFGQSTVIENSFLENARGFCELDNTVHDEDGESIELSGITYPIVSYDTSGSVESTVRATPGDVWEVFLSVEEDKPLGTDITYQISTDGGVTWSEDITPGTDPNVGEQWLLVKELRNEDDTADMVNGDRIVLRAKLTGDGTDTPILESWTLLCRQTLAGEAHDIKLIDEPNNLSALVDANYMTILRWQASATEGVTYNVYRSTNPYDQPSQETLLEEGITETYWNDFNLVPDTRFYYTVTAVKTYNIDGNDYVRSSMPSNEVFADTVSANELDKKLGLQNYWSYSGFKTSAGTGYINVANGNAVYKSTDMVVAGPFYGSVMSRTLNSLGNTKTPLGYGWDYSFNTCLLKEYDETGDNVVALILKDGDGSFHRFTGNDINGYSDAIGTFMSLEYNSVDSEYTIERKDGITYYFDATTMKLSKFIDLNSKELVFSYDARGNVCKIENSVGEEIELAYFIETDTFSGTTITEEHYHVLNGDGSTSSYIIYGTDYIYVNKFVDMLSSVKWTGNGNGKAIEYTYTYDEDDRLEEVNCTTGDNVDGEVTGVTQVVESYQYNINLDENPVTDDENIVITDAEGRITVIELDSTGKATNVYEPVDILSNYDQADKYLFNYDPDSDLSGDRTTITNIYGVGISYEYDTNGLLTKKEDAKGNSVSYEHNADFQVTKVMYDNQRDESSQIKNLLSVYSYNENGNISEIKAYSRPDSSQNIGDENYYTDLGPETTFTYHETFVNKVASTTVKKDSGDTVTTLYTYDQNGNINTTTVADGSINLYERAIGPMAKTTTYEYYGINDPNGLQWQLKSVEDEYGKSTRYIYDSKGRVTDVEEYLGSSYQRTVSTYTYDDFYRTDTISEPYDKNGSTTPNVIDYDYDAFGRLETQTNIDDTREEWAYDDTGRLVLSSISAYSDGWYLENSTSYQYDLLGRLTETEIYNDPNDTDDSVISQVDYTYDNASLGIVGGKWDSDPAIPGVDADVIVSTDAEGTQSLQYYDILGRPVETKIYDGTTYITTAQYTYDKIGNMIEAKDSADRVTRAYYDDLNRQIKTVADPFDLPGTDNMNIETQFEYDYLGNTTQVTQVSYESEANQTATNYVTNYEYDDMSRLKKVSQENPNYGNPGEPEYLETNYYYDWLVYGQDLVKNYVVDPNGMVKETYFDYMGYKVMDFNKADMSDGDNNDGEYMKTQYEYDEIRGLVERITRTDGTYEVYDYDSIGRLEDINYYQEDATNSQTIEYTYTNLGLVKTETMTDRNPDNPYTHKTQYNYDRMGQTIHVWGGTWDAVVTDPNVQASDGLDVAYEYNKAGQLVNINYDTSVTDGEHNIVYDYDNFGRINEIRFDPVENVDNNTVRSYDYETTTGELIATKDYRDFATATGTNPASYGNYIQTDFLYNSAGLLKQMTYTDTALGTNGNNITEQYTMEYDGRGSIVSEQIDTDYSTTDAMTSVFKAYEYDSLGRLVKAGNGDDEASSWETWDNLTEYTYDRVGNRMSMDDGTDTFTYEYTQFNQLEEVKKYDDSSQSYLMHESYTYDERGNQTVKYTDYSNGSATQAEVYDYDLLNRMTKVATPEDVADLVNDLTTINENIYNANEQRMRKTEYLYNGQGDSITRTEKYFYSGSALLYTQNGAGALRTENVIDLGGSIIASKRFDDDNDPNTPYELENQHFFYHYDMRGSVMNIVRPNGTLIEGYTYDEFGNKTQTEYDSAGNEITDPSDEIFENEVTFTSSITDTTTGLQYMNARYYEPTTGRFISQDSYTGNAYDPWTQHLYSYCGNNPTNMIDPTGHSAEDIKNQIRTLSSELNRRHGLINHYTKRIKSGELDGQTGYAMYGRLISSRKRVKEIGRELEVLRGYLKGLEERPAEEKDKNEENNISDNSTEEVEDHGVNKTVAYPYGYSEYVSNQNIPEEIDWLDSQSETYNTWSITGSYAANGVALWGTYVGSALAGYGTVFVGGMMGDFALRSTISGDLADELQEIYESKHGAIIMYGTHGVGPIGVEPQQ